MAGKRRNRDGHVIDIEKARDEKRKKRAEISQKRNKRDKTSKEGLSPRKTAKIYRRRLIYSTVFIIIAVIIGMSIFNVVSLKLEEDRALKELEALKREKQSLESELSTVDSKEYIEQQARSQLRMIYPDETLYVLKDDENAGEN